MKVEVFKKEKITEDMNCFTASLGINWGYIEMDLKRSHFIYIGLIFFAIKINIGSIS